MKTNMKEKWTDRIQSENIPTNKGDMTIPQIFCSLMYGSYEANRDLGMPHDSLVKLNIGNDEFKRIYEAKNNVKS